MAGSLIIDTHLHLYRSQEEGLAQINSYDGYDFGTREDVPPYSHYRGDPTDALDAIAKAGVSRAIAVHLFSSIDDRFKTIAELPESLSEDQRKKAIDEINSTAGEELKESNVWFCQVAKDNPQLIPYIGIDPLLMSAKDATDHLRDMVENHGAKGIKLHSIIQRFMMGDEIMWPIYQTCLDLDIGIVAHSGKARGDLQYGDPESFVPVYKAFPDLKLIMAHLGCGSWRQTREVAEALPNAMFDCCEIMEWAGRGSSPSIRELAQLIKDVGPERVMMGSDFPWWTPAHSVEIVMDMPILSKEEKEGILGANAVRLLGI